MIAMFLKLHKPKSKLIVLDGNPDIISKKDLFSRAGRSPKRASSTSRPVKKVMAVDAKNMSVLIEGIEEIRGCHQRHPASEGRRHRRGPRG